jgi:hypothetical protein
MTTVIQGSLLSDLGVTLQEVNKSTRVKVNSANFECPQYMRRVLLECG